MPKDKASAPCRSNFIFTLLLMLAAGISSAMAQTPADSIDGRMEALNAILPAYNDWQTAALSGKLRMKKLPVSPAVRIFMRRNEAITISVRASLLGEVGRIDIEGATVLAVNKMKRVYCKESLAGIKYDYPDIIGDIQSLLLGRAVALQAGELSEANADFFDFRSLPADSIHSEAAWSLTFPRGRSEEDEFGYEYRINSLGQTENLTLELSTADHEIALSLDYTYPGKGFDLDISFTRDFDKKFEASVEFNDIDWEANAPSPVSLNSRYTRVGIKQFISSF
ncbi:MAG: DUF4292 domain-containing protein [Muribaculaceae bacterium]|nr:DUF4292 domain-containing protein [Muribaculaceae bacterium]